MRFGGGGLFVFYWRDHADCACIHCRFLLEALLDCLPKTSQ